MIKRERERERQTDRQRRGDIERRWRDKNREREKGRQKEEEEEKRGYQFSWENTNQELNLFNWQRSRKYEGKKKRKKIARKISVCLSGVGLIAKLLSLD